jgi:peroxiredoxin
VPEELAPGTRFPDLDPSDHTGRGRSLSEIAGGDPVALFTSRGWWCPKEQRYMCELCRLQEEFEVAYTRIVVVSVDSPEVQSAFRAGLGARFTFLSDADRRWLSHLPLCEGTDTLHDPYRPAALRYFRISLSTAPTTAIGTGAGRRWRSCGATCAR